MNESRLQIEVTRSSPHRLCPHTLFARGYAPPAFVYKVMNEPIYHELTSEWSDRYAQVLPSVLQACLGPGPVRVRSGMQIVIFQTVLRACRCYPTE